MRAHRCRQPVVGDARQTHRILGIQFLQAGIGVRQHLHVDSRLVHFLDAETGKIVQALCNGGKLFGVLGCVGPHHVRILVMFLDRDDTQLCWH